MRSIARWTASALALALGLSLTACRDEHTAAGTGLFVEVRFGGLATPLTQLRFTVRTSGGETLVGPVARPEPPASSSLSTPQSVRVRLDDALDGQEMVVTVEGLAEGGVVVASGEGRATVTKGREQDVVVTLQAPVTGPRLSFSSAPRTVVAGECSTTVGLAALDAESRPLVQVQALQISLFSSASPLTTTFYSDPGCTQAIASVSMPAGESAATFFFKDTAAGTPTLTASPAASVIAAATQQQTITPAAVAQLSFTSPSGPVQAGGCGQLTVERRDAFGNLASPSAELPVTLASTSGTLSFFASADCSGVAATEVRIPAGASSAPLSFRDTAVGTPRLAGTSAGLLAADRMVTIVAGPAATLAFTAQPMNGTAGAPLSPAIQVSVRDAFGNAVSSAAPQVTLALAPASPPGATLSGATTVTAAGGVATFSAVSLDRAASGYLLRATAMALAEATSAPFAIAPAAADRLIFVTQPSDQDAGAFISPAVRVALADPFGNTDPSASATVTVTLDQNPGGGTLSGTTSAATASGVASFSDLALIRAASGYTLQAAAAGLASATSAAFTIRPAGASGVFFTTQPTSATAGATITPAPQVVVRDAYGNTVTTWSSPVTVAIGANPGGGTLSGTTTLPPAGGLASFSGLSINRSGSGYQLVASSGSLATATSASFDIAAGTPTALAYLTQPSNVLVNADIAPAVRVAVVDDRGNTVTSPVMDITMAVGVNPGGGALSGTLTQPTSNGIATFPDLRLDLAGNGYTLQASAAGLPSQASSPFDVAPSSTLVLFFLQEPVTTQAGATMPQIQVQVRNGSGTPQNTAVPITLSISTNPGGGTLSGTFSAVNSSPTTGIATFSDLSINRTGQGYRLTATSPGLVSATSATFDVTPGSPAALAFAVQPTTTTAGASIVPAVEVTVLDSLGNLVTTSSASITLALVDNPGSGILSGTLTQNAASGRATFSNLTIDRAASGYRLGATATGLPAVQSAFFDILVGPPAQLAFTTQPGTTAVNRPIAPAVEVAIQDSQGNTVNSTAMVTMSLGVNPTGATLSGTTQVAAVAGVATFSNLLVSLAGSGYQLQASSSPLTAGLSSSFTITPPPAALLTLTPASHDYGTTPIGNTRSQTFTLENTGGTEATMIAQRPFSFGELSVGGGTCVDSKLGPGQSCTVIVDYTPFVPGTITDALLFDYHDGAQMQSVQSALTGTGAFPALLTISEAPAYDYGKVATNGVASHTFTVNNTGGMRAESISAAMLTPPFRFAGGNFPGTGGDCASTLDPATSCRVVVELAPTADGPVQDELRLSYNDGSTIAGASCSLTGEAHPPALLTLSEGPGTFSFGTWGVGRSFDHQFVVQNKGGLAATAIAGASLAAPFSYKGGAFPGTGGTCGATLAADARCGVVVTFAPSAAGPINRALTLDYDNGIGRPSVTRNITGTGTNAAWLAFTDFPLPYYSIFGLPGDAPVHNFGPQGVNVPAVRPFYLTNTGLLDASIGAAGMGAPFSFHGGGTFPGQGGTCGATVAPGQQCVVMLEYTPSDETRSTTTATVSYTDGAASTLSATRDLTGTGTLAAALRIEDFEGFQLNASWDFGQRGVGVPSEWTFWVRNTGAQRATGMAGAAMTGVSFEYKGGVYPGAGGTCDLELEPGDTCLIAVAFTPALEGEHADTVGVQYLDGVGGIPIAQRAVHGTGATGPLLIFDNRNGGGGGLFYDYGPRPVGLGWPASFAVLNVGTDTATGLGGPAPTPPFSYSDGASFPGAGGSCGSSLEVGQHCRLAVSYAPTVAGSHAAAIQVSYMDSSGAQRDSRRAVLGRAVDAATLVISDYPQEEGSEYEPFSFGTAGIASDHTFYVRNVGPASATGLGIGALPAPFSMVGTNCGNVLAAGGQCGVTVRFTPAGGEERHGATLQVTYTAGTTSFTARRDLTATSTLNALILTADYPDPTDVEGQPLSFGTTGQPVDRLLYLANRGGREATGLQVQGFLGGAFTFKGGSYPGQGGNCGLQLPAGQRCTVVITFTPPSFEGLHSGVLHVQYVNDGASGLARARHGLAGTSTTGPYLVIRDNVSGGGSNGPYDFGTAGTPIDRSFTVVNVGASAASGLTGGPMINGFSFKDGSFPGTGGTCQPSVMGLAPGQQCTVVVTFMPVGDGRRGATLLVSASDPGNPSNQTTASRDLVATATTRALLRIVDESYQVEPTFGPFDYGVTGLATDHTFHVQSIGAQAAGSMTSAGPIGTDFQFKGGSYPGQGGTCPVTGSLAPGTTCTVVVTFAPAGNGARSGRIVLGYQDSGGGRQAARDVAGIATSTAYLVIQDFSGGGGCTQNCGPYDFGTWGVPVDHTFTVRNTGAQAASSITQGAPMGGDFGFKGGSFPGTGGSCQTATPLASGATCTVVVTFTPMGNGPRGATLGLSYHDGITAGRAATRGLAGTATTEPLLVIGDFSGATGCVGPGCSPFDFGTWGITAEHTFYVRNTGGSGAQSMNGQMPGGAAFGFRGGGYPGGGTCPTVPTTSLPPGATCTVVVTFRQFALPPGPYSGTLEVTYQNSAFNQLSATRALAGTATDRAFLTVRDNGPSGCSDHCGPFNYGSVTGRTPHTFTVFNSGALTGTGLNPASPAFTAPQYDWGGLLGYPGGGTCPTLLRQLDPGSSCTIVVDFSPTNSGTFPGRVNLVYSDSSGGPQLNAGRNLTGSRP